MKVLIAFGLLVSFSCFAQKRGGINIDGRGCEGYPLLGDSIRVQKALDGLEPYLKSVLGDDIVKNNLWLQYCSSNFSSYNFFGGTMKNPKRLDPDTGYVFQFYLVEDSTVIGYLDLPVDKNGGLLKYDYTSEYPNLLPLLLGFKRHFRNQFPISYKNAIEIGLKKGFINPPQLACTIDTKYLERSDGEVYIKVKYYWNFHVYTKEGSNSELQIDAETGKIESEIHIPRMPK